MGQQEAAVADLARILGGDHEEPLDGSDSARA